MIWPTVEIEPCVTITPVSLESIASAVLGGGTNVPNFASAQWQVADTAILFPFTLTKRATFVEMYTVTGGTSAGDVAVGIYDSNFTRLVSSSSTQGATNALQTFNITDTTIGPGLFYLAINATATTATFFRGTAGLVQQLNAAGVVQATSTGTTLPAVAAATTLSTAINYIPLFCATMRATL